MSRSIEQNLLSLMPTHGNELPPRLVDTARTLLTQSRQRASTLKADEEVARMYACAHVACERLKILLDLPPIEPRPPIPPRVYKRLFTHLDNILPGRQPRVQASTPNAKTPESRKALGSGFTRSHPEALDRSVSRSATKVTPKQVTLVNTPTKSTSKGFVSKIVPGVGLHPWIRPVLGVLIHEFKQQKWGKIVLGGIQHVVAPGNRRTRDAWVERHLTATVAAIFAGSIYVVDTILSGGEANLQVRAEMLERTMVVMDQARQELDVKGLSDGEFWDGWTSVSEADVSTAMGLFERDWCDSEWFVALAEGAETARSAAVAEGASSPAGKKRRFGPEEVKVRMRKADTMHHERHNFLSRERREAYAAWKEDVLARIAAAEEAGDTAMAGVVVSAASSE